VFNIVKKLVYIWLLAYLAFMLISVFSGGSVMRELGQKFGLSFFEKLADESDGIKRKADSFLRRTDRTKDKGEEKPY